MATVYEVARNLKMAGVIVDAHLDPTKLTKRMFNSARKMIASGRVTGWGEASRVARHVLNSKDVPFIGEDKWGVRVHGRIDLSEDAKAQCREMYQAFIMIRKSQDRSEYTTYWESKLRTLESLFEKTNKHNYIQCDLKEYREQLADVFLQSRFSADVHKAQQALTAFETGQLFPVNMFQ